MSADSGNSELLVVSDLTVGALSKARVAATIVDGVSFAIKPGEIVALVGGTGSGKTLTGRAIIGVLPPGIQRLRGHVIFDGKDLTACDEGAMRAIRGADIAMIVQNPRSALHPLHRIGDQMKAVMKAHDLVVDDVDVAVEAALQEVRIADPRRVMHSLPHELSGGMAQRVVIAIALLTNPRLLIADEPTTGLDVTVQAQVLELIETEVRAMQAAALIITHDLGIVAQHCERVLIMDQGRVTESQPVRALFSQPQSAYGQRLVNAARRDAQNLTRWGS